VATEKGHELLSEHLISTREQLLRLLQLLSPDERRVVGEALAALVRAGPPDEPSGATAVGR
jgi:DNA-binding MarR family transcriptional regulator